MPQYKLRYFNVRGVAELTRLIFAQAGVEYTDNRIEMNEWAEEKKNCKFSLFWCYIYFPLISNGFFHIIN